MSGGNLINPRVLVSWGDTNLSSYNGAGGFPKNAPLVYDVEVSLQSEVQAPTGSMKWDPTGPGFAIYESFISSEKYMKTRIYVDFFYSGGKRIRFSFVWAGQSINYGNDMSVTVKLRSDLEGQVNANIRNVTQAYDEKKGKGGTFVESLKKGSEQYKIENKKLLLFNETAEKDLEKAKLTTNYATDQTYGAFISNTVQQNGNTVFASNIGNEPNIIVFPPFSWDKEGDVKDGAKDFGQDGPDPTKRYGYLVGPSIINTLTRSSEWKPPQQTNSNNPSTQTQPRDPTTGRFVKTNPPQKQDDNTDKTAKPTSAVLGTANARPNPGVQNNQNEDGPKKQIILNQEGTADMNFNTLMVPVLVGIKPYDIVYVASFKGTYIEDWIVDSVSYDQSDGNVSISVTCKRTLGLGTPMNEKSAKKFSGIAKGAGLVGDNATLESWDKYAWTLNGDSAGTGGTAPKESEEAYYNRIYGEA